MIDRARKALMDEAKKTASEAGIEDPQRVVEFSIDRLEREMLMSEEEVTPEMVEQRARELLSKESLAQYA